MDILINRKQYMEDKAEGAHHRYYSQFVTNSVRDYVASCVGIETIRNSSDPHFNDIPLERWDRLHKYLIHLAGRALADSNASTQAPGTKGGISLSDTVCVAKAAARIIKGDI